MHKLLVATLFVLFSVMPSLAAPTNTSGPWGVEASAFKNLSSALASSSTADKTVVISKPMPINNYTLQTNRHIRFVRGGRIDPAAGKTFDFNGQNPEAGDYQIFGGAGNIRGLTSPRTAWFGADPSGVQANFGVVLQRAIDSMGGIRGVVKIGIGNFKADSGAVVSTSYIKIEGEGESSVITLTGDFSLISTPPSPSTTVVRGLILKDFSVFSSLSAVTKYTFDFYNVTLSGLDTIFLSSNSTAVTDKTGVVFYRADSVKSSCFENYVKNSFFNNALISMRVSDGEITDNLQFAQYKAYGIHVGKGNQLIRGNELIGPATSGSILVEDVDDVLFSVDKLKIEANETGASQDHATVPTGWGIVARSAMTDSSIIGNTFYHESKGGIYLGLDPDAIRYHTNNTIVGNSFKNCNKEDNGYSDIDINYAIGNVIGLNTHSRDSSHLNKGYAIKADGNSFRNIFSSVSVLDKSYYLSGTFNFSAGSTFRMINSYPETTSFVTVSPSSGVLDLRNVTQSRATTGVLNQNITEITMPLNAVDGFEFTIYFNQRTSGSPAYTVSGWPTGLEAPTPKQAVRLAGGSYTLSTNLGSVDSITFVYREATQKWIEKSRSLNMLSI